MKCAICVAATLLLCGCGYAPAPTDGQVSTVAALCKEHGLVVSVFVGATTRIDCVKPEDKTK